jgi:hypothetical protein
VRRLMPRLKVPSRRNQLDGVAVSLHTDPCCEAVICRFRGGHFDMFNR